MASDRRLEAGPVSRDGSGAVRAFRNGDEIAVNGLWHRAHGGERSLDEWSWLYPPEDGTRMIAVAEDDGGVAAVCGGRSIRVAMDDREWKAVQIHEIVAASGADGGANSDLINRVVRGFFDLFGSNRSFRLVLSAVDVECGFPSHFEDAPVRRIPVFVRERAAFPSPARFMYRAELARDWEPRLDDLWSRVRATYKAAVVRDADYAMRRFAGHPTVRYHRFLILPRFADRAVAFVALTNDGGRCRWRDLVWDNAHPGALELAAHISGRLAAQTQVAAEELWLAGDGDARKLLEGRGFREVKTAAAPIVTVRSLDPELDGRAFLRRAYLTMADAGRPPS
jgi:hypothetical protein